MATNPLLRKCCPDRSGGEEITIIPASDHLEIPEVVFVLAKPHDAQPVGDMDVSENLPNKEKLDMSHQIHEERTCQIVVPAEQTLSLMPLPVKIGSINVQPMSSALALTSMKEPVGYINVSVREQRSLMVPELDILTGERMATAADRTPRGDYLLSETADVGKVTPHDLVSMEEMVAKMAGSPLGCISFETTFRTRQQNNKIITLRGHSLEGLTFGDISEKYTKVTMFALKKADGRVMWAPASYVRIESSDAILLIACTPFAMAMGLGRDASLSESSLIPCSTPGVEENFKPRRCCV